MVTFSPITTRKRRRAGIAVETSSGRQDAAREEDGVDGGGMTEEGRAEEGEAVPHLY